MLSGKEAVIFDLDGTLVDSMWMWHDIDVRFLGERGLAMPPDLQRAIGGMSMTETAVYFRERFGLTESVPELIGIWNDMARDAYRYHVPLKEGAEEFLKRLRREGIPTAIATSNSGELLSVCFDSLSLDRYIDVCVSTYDVERGKPAPDVFLLAASRLFVSPASCLAFEDILPGIAAAHAAGMEVCAVYDKYCRDDEAEKKARADYYIRDFYEVV